MKYSILNKLKVIFILTIVGLFFCLCQKKIFKDVEVKGRLFHSITQQPFPAKVYLYTDDATSAKNGTEATIELGSTTASSDGSFTIKTNASKRGIYYLYVEKNGGKGNSNAGGSKNFTMSDNSTKDFGDIFVDW